MIECGGTAVMGHLVLYWLNHSTIKQPACPRSWSPRARRGGGARARFLPPRAAPAPGEGPAFRRRRARRYRRITGRNAGGSWRREARREARSRRSKCEVGYACAALFVAPTPRPSPRTTWWRYAPPASSRVARSLRSGQRVQERLAVGLEPARPETCTGARRNQPFRNSASPGLDVHRACAENP